MTTSLAGDGGSSISTVAQQREENVHVRNGISEEAFVAMRRSRDAALDMPVLMPPAAAGQHAGRAIAAARRQWRVLPARFLINAL